MSLSSQPQPEPSLDFAIQLLREGDWVRSLARALLHGDADAEDLAQDVLLEALETQDRNPCAGVPRRMRAWLGTVVRRRAVDHLRRRSKGRAALSDLSLQAAVSEDIAAVDSDDRLALHEELTRVLWELPQLDRELLIRRHIDRVAPRQLAVELGLAPEQVRKRLSRALARVRQKLGATKRGGAGWQRALLVIAERRGWDVGVASHVKRGSPPTSALSGGIKPIFFTTLSAMSIAAKLAALTALALTIGAVWWLQNPEQVPPETTIAQSEGRESAAIRALEPLGLSDDSSRTALEMAQSESAASAEEELLTALGSDVRVVDVTGQAVTDANGVWIDATSALHPFAVDEQGSFVVDADSPVSVFVRNETLSTTYAEVPALAAGSAGKVVMHPRPPLSLRVTVDGAPPWERIAFPYYGASLMKSIDTSRSQLLAELKELGFPPAAQHMECSPEGVLETELEENADSIWLRVPDGYAPTDLTLDEHRSETGTGWRVRESFRVQLGNEQNQIDLTRLPAIEGRFLWEDSREPFTDGFMYSRTDPEGFMIGGSVGTQPNSEGRFRVPVNELKALAPGEWLQLSSRPKGIRVSDLLGEQAVTVRLDIYAKGAVRKSYSFPVGDEFSSVDVGDILVERVPEIRVRTLGWIDGEWQPIQAGVSSSQSAVETDEDGRAVLAYWPGDFLEVLAIGFDFSRVPVPEGMGQEELEIHLDPAPTLDVVVPRALLDPSGQHQPQVRIAYQGTPFGSWNDPSAPSLTMTHRLYEAYVGPFAVGTSKLQSNSMLVPVPPSGLVRIAGLRKGAAIDLSIVDCNNDEYVTRSIVFDRPLRLEDWPKDLQSADLDVEILDSGNAVSLSGRYRLHAENHGGVYSTFKEGRLRAGPVAPGIYTLTLIMRDETGASTTRAFNDIELLKGSNSRSLDLAVD